MSLNQLSPIAQAELETGTTTRPPKLKGAEDFSTWKARIQSFFEYTDYNLWLSVTAGPHIPTVVRGDAVVANNDATTFTDEDKALIQHDRRAHVALTMALSTNDCNMFEEHRTANAHWNALSEYYEGNEELIESKRDMVQKQYDMFCGVRGESLSDHISRFLNMMTKMKKAGNPVTNRAAIKKLLDSLPKEWSLQCMMIKKDFLNNPNPVTLSDLINTLRAFEMDVNKREMNTAGYPPKTNQTSVGLKNMAFLASGGISPQASDLIYANASTSASKAPQPSEKTITVGDTQALKVSTENVALFNMFLSSYEALMSGELKKEMFTAEDMLKKFQDKTGKHLGLGKAGFDKSKLRCYNCKNLGHFKRDCPLLKEGNIESTPDVKQITSEENKNNASPSTPKALVVEDYDWSEEIAEAKEQVNKALMAKISSESSSKQFEKQTAGIPKGDNIADKGLKSILTSTEPEKEKKSEEAEEHVSEEVSDQKKGKEKVPAAAMKTESSKEKADKDLAFTDIKNCRRPTYVKDGIGYKDRQGNERKFFFPPHSKNYVPMPTPHPENDLIDEKASVEQNDFCESETTANFSKSNADPIVCKEDVCDEDGDCGGSNIGIELKKNSFGKFLTEEIPEFIPSRTGMTNSKKSVTEDHCNEDSSITASEDEQKSESSSEDRTTDGESLEFSSEETPKTSSEDQTTNDESSECSSVETIEDQDSESSSEVQSCNDSSYEASEEQSSSEYLTSESSSDSDRHTAKHCKNKKFSKPEYDFVTNFTYQLNYLKKSVKKLVESTAYFWKQKEDNNKLQKWLRMLMEYIWHVDSGCSRHMTGLKELLKNFRFIDGDFVSFAGDEKGGKIVGIGDVVSEALTLENVNYVPELCYNLMSVSQVCDKEISVFFKPEYVVPAEMIMLTAPRQNNTYVLNMKNAKTNDNLTCLISKASESESLLWHRRLGHMISLGFHGSIFLKQKARQLKFSNHSFR
ncbi:uncharacterized protein LOC110875915 [Helianthus annuus]|uniref:uncharacterized protein LOC110875915 n=1 Tax=Helianthus annuus TaxID=4232 RepID=UPI000B8F5021|nr:uncharacterized protein LOC110875915 [Helianthus annuus]